MIFSQGTGGTGVTGGTGGTGGTGTGTGGGSGGGSTAAPSPSTSPPSYQWSDKDYLVSPSTGQDTPTQSGKSSSKKNLYEF